jgi:hypothetical protein
VTGPAVPVVDGVQTKNSGAANFAVSQSGLLVYAPGTIVSGGQLVWVDRQGHEQLVPTPRVLFEDRYKDSMSYSLGPTYDISRDGKTVSDGHL